MLTHLQIKNFKAWQDTGDIKLAPLTVIFGPNSSGKSSLGHFLLALKQTALSADRNSALRLGDRYSLIDLGTFQDCLFGHDIDESLDFSLRWKLPKPMEITDALKPTQKYGGEELALKVNLDTDSKGQPQTTAFTYQLLSEGQSKLEIIHKREKGKIELECSPLSLVRATGRQWPLEPPEKFYRFADLSLSRYQNANFMVEFSLAVEHLLENIYYLGPLREPPRRMYSWSGDTPSDVGQNGEYTIPALLAATAAKRKLNHGPKRHYHLFDQFIATWLKDMGMIYSFDVAQLAAGRKDYEVLVRVNRNSPEVKLTDVGFGVSQVLPALVEAFYAPKNSVIWMEQPEIHLHPSVQANLADVFISAIQASEDGIPRNVQLIVESHSEHLLTRLQRRIAEGVISVNDVAIYFVQHGRAGAQIEPLTVNEYGEIANWPENFFGNELEEIGKRTLAALQRKQQEFQA